MIARFCQKNDNQTPGKFAQGLISESFNKVHLLDNSIYSVLVKKLGCVFYSGDMLGYALSYYTPNLSLIKEEMGKDKGWMEECLNYVFVIENLSTHLH